MAGKCTSQMEVKHHYRNPLTQRMSQAVQITGNQNIPRSIIAAKPLPRIWTGPHAENQDSVPAHTHSFTPCSWRKAVQQVVLSMRSTGLNKMSRNPRPLRDLALLGRHNNEVDERLNGKKCKGSKNTIEDLE